MTRGFVQFGNPFQYNYDPVCFDVNIRTPDNEFSVVRVDHEDVLCERRNWKVSMVATSFLTLIRGFSRA